MGQNHCHQGLGRDLGPDGPLPSEGKGPHRGTPVLSQLPLDHSPGTERHRWTRHHPAQLWTSAVSSLRSVRKAPVFFYGLFGPPVGF